MSSVDVIKKALLLNNMCENDVTVVETEKRQYIIHIFEIVVLLLCNFFLLEKENEEEKCNFIMKNFNTVVDLVMTEIEVNLLAFDNLYEQEITDIVELHNKDECLLVVAIQDKVNKKIKNL